MLVRSGVLLTVGFLSVFAAFAGSKEQTFWSWFQRNSDTLYHFERDRQRIFDQLAAEMHRVNPELTFEFGSVLDDGAREFVISAGGVKTAFPAVEIRQQPYSVQVQRSVSFWGSQPPLSLIYQCLARQQVGYRKTAYEVLATTYAVTHSGLNRTSNRRNSGRYCSRPS